MEISSFSRNIPICLHQNFPLQLTQRHVRCRPVVLILSYSLLSFQDNLEYHSSSWFAGIRQTDDWQYHLLSLVARSCECEDQLQRYPYVSCRNDLQPKHFQVRTKQEAFICFSLEIQLLCKARHGPNWTHAYKFYPISLIFPYLLDYLFNQCIHSFIYPLTV